MRRHRLSVIGANVRFGFKLSWRTGRTRTFLVVLVPLLQSLLPAALALVLRSLVNRAVEVVGGESSDSAQLGLIVALSFVLAGSLALTQSLQQYLSQSNLEALEHRLSIDVIEHASSLEFAYFEQPEFQDMFRHVGEMPAHHVHELVTKSVRSVASLLTVGSLFVILLQIEPLVVLYFLPLTVPYLLFRSWVAKSRFLTTKSQTRGRRWAQYYSSQVTTEATLPEVRTFDLAPLFVRKLKDTRLAIGDENQRLFRIELWGSALFNVMAVLVVHIALFQTVGRVGSGSLTVGDIAIFATAAAGLRGAIDGLVMAVAGLRWHLAVLADLDRFFALGPPVSSKPVLRVSEPVDETIAVLADGESGESGESGELRVKDLTFSYPGVESPILDGLTFDVAPGETVAVVGRNGSGKSTLVKLLTRLYQPDSGSIRISGTELSAAEAGFVRDNVAVVFQQFGRFAATASENIAMGNWRQLLEEPEKVRATAQRVGLDCMMESLPQGYDTLLGREFGEVTLSGGQWQTVAIARAFARDAPLMILDEPTANLDAEAEYEVFSHFKELTEARSTLLISHRFATLALADRIVVLEDGRACEQGTHAELVASGGAYARLYSLYRRQGDGDVWGGAEEDRFKVG
jgi:ATP-binding cassette, subfamily B, bacterial